MMTDHSDNGNGYDGYDPEEDPFDPGDPAYQPEAGRGGGGRFDVPPPVARYPMMIQSWEMSEEPGASGYHYINMAIAIQQEGNWKSFWVWEILSYSPKSNPRWAALFNALGWTPEHGKLARTDPNVLSQWFDSGILFWAQTKIETYRGKRKAKIHYYIPRNEQPHTDASGYPAQDQSQGGHEDYPPPGGNPNAHDDRPFDGAPGPGYTDDPNAGPPDGYDSGDDDDMPF